MVVKFTATWKYLLSLALSQNRSLLLLLIIGGLHISMQISTFGNLIKQMVPK